MNYFQLMQGLSRLSCSSQIFKRYEGLVRIFFADMIRTFSPFITHSIHDLRLMRGVISTLLNLHAGVLGKLSSISPCANALSLSTLNMFPFSSLIHSLQYVVLSILPDFPLYLPLITTTDSPSPWMRRQANFVEVHRICTPTIKLEPILMKESNSTLSS